MKPRQVILVKSSDAIADVTRLKTLVGFYDVVIVRDEDFEEAVKVYLEVAKYVSTEVTRCTEGSNEDKEQRSESDSVSSTV